MKNRRTLLCIIAVMHYLICTMAWSTPSTTVPETQLVGIKIENIYDINEKDSTLKLTARVTIKHQYKKPDPIGQLEFLNATKQSHKIISSTKTTDGMYLSTAKFYTTLKQQFNMRDYPFDTQNILIAIRNLAVPNDKLILKPDQSLLRKNNSLISDMTLPSSWHVFRTAITSQSIDFRNASTPIKDDTITYSKILLHIAIKRESYRDFAFVFSTLYIAFLLYWYGLTLPATKENEYSSHRNNYIASAAFFLVGNFLITQPILASTHEFCKVDIIQLITLLFLFVTIIFSATISRTNKSQFALNRLNQIRKYIATSMFILYAVANIYILM